MDGRLILPARRDKATWVLLGSLALVAASAWLREAQPLIAWAGIAFFGLGIAAGTVLLLRPGLMYLALDREAFEMGSPLRKVRIPWAAVEDFEIVQTPARLIAIHYRPDYMADAGGRAFARALSGLEGGIPDLYARRLDELLPLLRGFLQVHREDHDG